jgi:hypothetical protein
LIIAKPTTCKMQQEPPIQVPQKIYIHWIKLQIKIGNHRIHEGKTGSEITPAQIIHQSREK